MDNPGARCSGEGKAGNETLQKGFDPSEHGLPKDLRLCECAACLLHDDWISGDVCARPFLLENGSSCPKCLLCTCAACSIHCGLCALAVCKVCDQCPTCECFVCSACVPKKACAVCRNDHCASDGVRCVFSGYSCTYCKHVVCESCSDAGGQPAYFEKCYGVSCNMRVCYTCTHERIGDQEKIGFLLKQCAVCYNTFCCKDACSVSGCRNCGANSCRQCVVSECGGRCIECGETMSYLHPIKK